MLHIGLLAVAVCKLVTFVIVCLSCPRHRRDVSDDLCSQLHPQYVTANTLEHLCCNTDIASIKWWQLDRDYLRHL